VGGEAGSTWEIAVSEFASAAGAQQPFRVGFTTMSLTFPTRSKLSNADAGLALDAAQKVVETHRRLSKFLAKGQTLAQVDAFVAKTLADLSCKSCFLGYRQRPSDPKFPSFACLSLNECVVHGTAGYTTVPLKKGDLLKIDIGVSYRGWIGDAAWTYSIGEPTKEIKRLMECGKECLRLGIKTLRPENTYLEWAKAVQGHVEEKCGFHLIRGLGGHGYGKTLHAVPYVSNVVPRHPSDWPDAIKRCEVGTLLAVEPMIAIGTGEIKQKRGEWPIMTADGSMSVHYEHDVQITESGPKVLTEGLDDLVDVIEA